MAQVCWHEGSIGDLADSLRRFAPRGSTVTVISREEPEVMFPPRCSVSPPAHIHTYAHMCCLRALGCSLALTQADLASTPYSPDSMSWPARGNGNRLWTTATELPRFVTRDDSSLQGFPEGAAGPILRCKMTWQEGDPTDAGALSKAGVAHADAVILGAADSRPPKEVSQNGQSRSMTSRKVLEVTNLCACSRIPA